MPEINTIFLRTHSGKLEVVQKACGLTQSERQVLILVDGVTSYGGLVQKLERLKADRVARAINTLCAKGLISEVLLPVEDAKAEEFDAAVVERFLHQDPMDPVTIISFNPEDDFDDIAVPPQEADPSATTSHAPTIPVLEEWMAVPPPSRAEPAVAAVADPDEVTDEEVAQLVQQVRDRQVVRPKATHHTAAHLAPTLNVGHAFGTNDMPWRRWEYWLIGTGLMLIIGGTVLH